MSVCGPLPRDLHDSLRLRPEFYGFRFPEKQTMLEDHFRILRNLPVELEFIRKCLNLSPCARFVFLSKTQSQHIASEKQPVAYWQTLNTFWMMTLPETNQIYSRKYTVSTRLCVTSSQNNPSLTWNFQLLPQKFNSQTHKANETSTRK